jgi:SAM-dependent methyltransferase
LTRSQPDLRVFEFAATGAIGATLTGWPYFSTTESSPTHLPYPDSTFEIVLSQGMLGALPNPGPTLAEIVRVLRPGGALIASDRVDYLANALENLGLSVTADEPDHPGGTNGRTLRALTATKPGTVYEQPRPLPVRMDERKPIAETLGELDWPLFRRRRGGR